VRYANALGNWGRVLQQKGDLLGASQAFAEAQHVLASAGKSDTWMAAKLLIYQALIELDQGRRKNALQFATQAVALQTKLGGNENPQLAGGELCLGLTEMLSGDSSSAEAEFRSALEIRKHAFPPTHRDFLLAQVRLAEALLDEGRAKDAVDVMQSATANAAAAPFPLPGWQMAELRIVDALALREAGRESDPAGTIGANGAALESYPQAAVKNYLKERIGKADTRPSRLVAENLP
jgi:tetratricopeptide (TPR) repeat protein